MGDVRRGSLGPVGALWLRLKIGVVVRESMSIYSSLGVHHKIDFSSEVCQLAEQIRLVVGPGLTVPNMRVAESEGGTWAEGPAFIYVESRLVS